MPWMSKSDGIAMSGFPKGPQKPLNRPYYLEDADFI
tara:strand:- start:574 stop:681 length:108 start_codon:yes stop_codon:yes gene_type:complete